MKVTITPRTLSGTITPPPSKSQSHRLIIAAALADGESVLQNVARSQDIAATIGCLNGLEARFEDVSGGVKVHGAGSSIPRRWESELTRFVCCESGSTLRFLIPVALAVLGGGAFTGRGRLMERPQQPYFDLFDEKGIFYRQEDGVLTVRGELTPGRYALPGKVSSQFVTGLLYALPLLDGDSEIIITSELESRGYVDMTLDALEKFGVRVENRGYERFFVPGGQKFQPRDLTIEADWSQAGFWFAAKALGNQVDVTGLEENSAQGDRVMGEHFLRLCESGEVDIDLSGCPDLAPPLAAIAALRAGETTRLVNGARLRMKESDRLTAVREELCRLGAQVTEGEDSLTIVGKERLQGGEADAHNDHRIAMMLAIAATKCAEPVIINGAESVRKSYPNFWEDYERLGGEVLREEENE